MKHFAHIATDVKLVVVIGVNLRKKQSATAAYASR